MELIFAAFFFKHFLCDFPLQRAYQYKNKGTYGHPGGLLHASIHFTGTLAVCLIFDLPAWLPFADAIIHYHVDWAKVRLNDRFGLTPANSEYFWWLLGADQLLHYLTYAGLVWLSV